MNMFSCTRLWTDSTVESVPQKYTNRTVSPAENNISNIEVSFNCLTYEFLKKICPSMGPLIPLFRTSGDVCIGFQNQNGQPCLHLAQVYTIHIP